MRCGTMVKIARLPRNRYLLSSRKGPHIRFVSCALSSQQIQWNPGSSTRKQPLSRNRTGEPINSAWIMVSTLHCLLWMIVGELTLSYLTICIIRVTLNSTEFDTIWLSRVCAKTTCLNLMRPFANESRLTRVENDAPYNLKQFHVLTPKNWSESCAKKQMSVKRSTALLWFRIILWDIEKCSSFYSFSSILS